MSDVVLLGAVHDPEGRIAALLPTDLPLLQRHYTRILRTLWYADAPRHRGASARIVA